MLYNVVDFKIGKYDYDTLFIEAEDNIIQIPIKKNVGKTELINREIEIEYLNTPIEKL